MLVFLYIYIFACSSCFDRDNHHFYGYNLQVGEFLYLRLWNWTIHIFRTFHGGTVNLESRRQS